MGFRNRCDFFTRVRKSQSQKNGDSGCTQVVTPRFWEFPNLAVSNLVVCDFCAKALFHPLLHPFRGKKSIHHHRGTPPFSVCRPTPRSQNKKSYGLYHFPGKTREKGIHHRSGYTIRPQTRKKKERRVATVVVYTFFFPKFPAFCALLQIDLRLRSCACFCERP